jgi:hypothetical protein
MHSLQHGHRLLCAAIACLYRLARKVIALSAASRQMSCCAVCWAQLVLPEKRMRFLTETVRSSLGPPA